MAARLGGAARSTAAVMHSAWRQCSRRLQRRRCVRWGAVGRGGARWRAVARGGARSRAVACGRARWREVARGRAKWREVARGGAVAAASPTCARVSCDCSTVLRQLPLPWLTRAAALPCCPLYGVAVLAYQVAGSEVGQWEERPSVIAYHYLTTWSVEGCGCCCWLLLLLRRWRLQLPRL